MCSIGFQTFYPVRVNILFIVLCLEFRHWMGRLRKFRKSLLELQQTIIVINSANAFTLKSVSNYYQKSCLIFCCSRDWIPQRDVCFSSHDAHFQVFFQFPVFFHIHIVMRRILSQTV